MRKALLLGAIGAVLAAPAVSGCGATAPRSHPSISHEVSTGVITTDAPIWKKRTTQREWESKTRYVFDFRISNGKDAQGVEQIRSTSARVTKKVYDKYGVGDRIKVRCNPHDDFCVVLQ